MKAKKKPAKTTAEQRTIERMKAQRELLVFACEGHVKEKNALEAKVKAAEERARKATSDMGGLKWAAENTNARLVQCEERLAAYGKAVKGQAAYIAAIGD